MSVSSVAHSCPVLWDPFDCSPPGISVRGSLQASIQEWVAISSSRGSTWLSDWTHGMCIGRRLGRHLGKSLGALTALGNSVVMKSPVRKPRGQSSLCALPGLSLLGCAGIVSYKSAGSVQALVGTVGSRTWASSLCHVPLSFNELMPVELLGSFSKRNFQGIPWRLTGELPSPQLRDPAQPHSSGCLPLSISQRAPCRQGGDILP